MNDEQMNESTSEQINTNAMKGTLEGDKATSGAELNPTSHPRVHNLEAGGQTHPLTTPQLKNMSSPHDSYSRGQERRVTSDQRGREPRG